MRSLPLLLGTLLSCTTQFSSQYLAEQSAHKAKTKMSPAWTEKGPPAIGSLSLLAELTERALHATDEELSVWGVLPHDNRPNPESGRVIQSAQLSSIQMDGQGSDEVLLLFETYSGELFVALFSQASDQRWAWIDSQRLPSMALRRQCRSDSDGALIKGASMITGAPDFLWAEVQTSDSCASTTAKEKHLLVFSMQQAKLALVFSQTIERAQLSPTQETSGEQIKLSAKVDAKKNTLLLSGTKRMFPLSGGALLQEAKYEQWYYFDGARYQQQR